MSRSSHERPIAAVAAVSVAAGLAGVAGSYAVSGFTPSFVAAPIASFLARTLPGALLTFAITVLGEVGDLLNFAFAVALSVLVLAATSFVAILVGRRIGSAALGVGLTLVLGGLAVFAVTEATISALAAGVVTAFVVAAAHLATAVDLAPTRGVAVSPDRRRVVGVVAGAIGLSLVGYLLGNRQSSAGTSGSQPAALQNEGSTKQLLDQAKSDSFDVKGLEPLVSTSFYEVDINNVNPSVDRNKWTLSVSGAVDTERTYRYDDLTSMTSATRFNTLRCVGDRLNSDKLDNAVWTGVPVKRILDDAGAHGSHVTLRAVDDYYESFPIEALEQGLLAYGMNGNELPAAHGYPVRVLVPGHWGEINVKWVSEIEVEQQLEKSFWEERGWHGTGPVNTVATLKAVNTLDNGKKQVAGQAYAGTRGIKRVEVSTDGEKSWNDAKLSKPLPGNDVWRQWMYTYDAPGGKHEVVVRATDGEGTLQAKKEAKPYPNGPTGWVSKTVS